MSVALNTRRHINFEAGSQISVALRPRPVPGVRSGAAGGKEAVVKITVTGRHMDLTEVLKEYAVTKMERLAHYFDHISRAEGVFAPEKDGQYSAEIILHAPRHTILVVHAQEKTATGAFDIAIEKVERQLARLKDKLRGNTKTARARRAAAGEPEAVLGDASGDSWW
jgi:putative sigma-54 modulation protein